MKTVCKFNLQKVTPGALRYTQVEEDGEPVGSDANDKLIGTLYVRKSKIDGEPKTLIVTVETA